MSTSRLRKVRPPKIGRHSNGRLMTPEEFDAVQDYDDRYRYELVHGVLVVSPFAGPTETDPNEELGYLLRDYAARNHQGSVLDKTLFEHYLNVPNGRRRADRVIWTGLGRVPDPRKDVPTIAVEFVSKSTRDRARDYEEKRDENRAIGVKEYWVIDRFARTLTVHRQGAEAPEQRVVPAGGTYQTPLLPGFELSPGRLFTLADDWSAAKPKTGKPKKTK